MPKLTIDNVEIEVPAGLTVMQACQMAGKEIPHFCFHERLSVAGNCRMCLVEMEKSPKPIASCAMPAADGQVIRTTTASVQKARRGVMEFLLINHPLDCPICDQGGECDLQDQAMAYGYDRSRYAENKRAVDDKYMGPLVKTFMNRCIHCTRCVRFSTEVAGVEEMGAVGRGEHMEITTYLEKSLSSELSACVADLCPVGALTHKPQSFKYRSWELKSTDSIDVLDAMGSNVRMDARGNEVIRILPRLNEDINEEWLANKSRQAVDGLKRQRLDRPYVRKDGKLRAVSWDEALAAIGARLQNVPGANIAAIAGDQADGESVFLLKELMNRLGSPHTDCRQDGAMLNTLARGNYLFNTTIAGLEQADCILLIGANPRVEAPLLNARIRKAWLQKRMPIASIGAPVDLTYRHENLGDKLTVLNEILSEKHAFATALKNAKNPVIIVGMGALTRADGGEVLKAAEQLAQKFNALREDWNGFNILHTAAARVGALDLGFVPGQAGRDVAGILQGAQQDAIDVVYLLGADEIDASRLGKAFVIYQGHHGDRAAHRADVILPGAAYTEKSATYVNMEGRVQYTQAAAFPPGDAKEDWKIIRALSDVLKAHLPYDTLDAVRRGMAQVNAVFAAPFVTARAEMKVQQPTPVFAVEPVRYAITNYYQTCAISRASVVMAQCAEEVRNLHHKAAA